MLHNSTRNMFHLKREINQSSIRVAAKGILVGALIKLVRLVRPSTPSLIIGQLRAPENYNRQARQSCSLAADIPFYWVGRRTPPQ